MKATLEFTLPEEAPEHRVAINAGDVLSALSDLDNDLRAYLKYGTELPFVRADLSVADTPEHVAEYVRARLAAIKTEE